jgi:hypothetical protein
MSLIATTGKMMMMSVMVVLTPMMMRTNATKGIVVEELSSVMTTAVARE